MDEFLKITPRENAGQNTQQAFHYKNFWGLSLALDCYSAGTFSIIGFEHIDDIIQLDSNNPQKIFCYQIKTSINDWQLNKLYNAGQGKLSIMAKMVAHLVDAPNVVDRVYLVTNSKFRFIGGNCTPANADIELKSNDKNTIEQKIKSQIPQFDKKLLNKIYFFESSLSFKQPDQLLKGQISDAITPHYPGARVHIESVYKAWIEEANSKARANFESGDLNQFIDRKGISTDTIANWIRITVEAYSELLDASTILEFLADWPSYHKLRLKKYVYRHLRQEMDPTFGNNQALKQIICDELDQLTGNEVSVRGCTENARARIREKHGQAIDVESDEELDGRIVAEIIRREQ